MHTLIVYAAIIAKIVVGGLIYTGAIPAETGVALIAILAGIAGNSMLGAQKQAISDHVEAAHGVNAPGSSRISGRASLAGVVGMAIVAGVLAMLVGCMSADTKADIAQIVENAAALDDATSPTSTANPAKVHALAVATHALAVGVATETGVPTGTATPTK